MFLGPTLEVGCRSSLYLRAMGSVASNITPADAHITSVNPANGNPLAEVPNLSAADVKAAVDRARAAQVAWGALSVEVRCKRVLRFAEVLMARAEDLINTIVAEGGKTRLEALGMEVIVVADLTTTNPSQPGHTSPVARP